MGEIKVCWSVPMGETIMAEVFPHFLQIAGHGYPYIDIGQRRKDIVLNRLGQYMLGSEFTHLVVLDADHWHPHDIIEQLCYWPVRDPEKLVVGGLNFRRGVPYDPCAYIKGPDGNSYALTNFDPGLYRVSVLGGGSMLYAREVFERLPYPWFQCAYDGTSETPGEDAFFSGLCEKHGIPIWCDTTVTSPHLATNWVDRWTFEDFLADVPQWNTPIMAEEAEEEFILQHLPGLFDAKRVLYVGADMHRRYHAEAWRKRGGRLTLLEVFPRNVAYYRRAGAPFAEVLQGDIVHSGPVIEQPYDVAFWWHGPEHVSIEDLPKALGNLEAVANLVVLGAPWGEFKQDVVYRNPHEAHKATLEPADLEQYGYQTATTGEHNAGTNCLLAWKKTK